MPSTTLGYRFRPARGGHAPGHLREMLDTYLETGEVPVETLNDPGILDGRDPLRWLCGQLWNCTDQLPGYLAEAAQEIAEDDRVDTYGRAARAIRTRMA